MLDILVPFYGDPGLMRQALRSVLDQTRPATRVIVVDDCYPDPSVASWIRSIDDSRIYYTRNEVNLGANANYRKALALATSDHVTFMGADDVMLPSFVEHACALIKRFDHPDVIQSGVTVIDHHGARHLPAVDRVKSWLRPAAPAARQLRGEEAIASILRGNWTYFPSIVWRTESARAVGFRDYDVVQDLALLVDVLREGGRMVLSDETTFAYRRHAQSDSGLKTYNGKRFEEESLYFRQVASELRTQGWRRAARAARLHSTSRLHAASWLPTDARNLNWRAGAGHLRHALGP